MVLVKAKVLEKDTGENRNVAEILNNYTEALEFVNYLVNKTSFNILKITMEEVEK